MREHIDINFIHRSQWVGFEGNPKSQLLSFTSPLRNLNSAGGIVVINDMVGAERNTFVAVSYGYKTSFKFGALSGGISAGMVQKALDGSQLRAPQGQYDETFTHNDDLIPEGQTSGWAPDFSAGIWFNTKNFYTGLSTTHIFENKVKSSAPGGTAKLMIDRIFYGVAGYALGLSKNVKLKPAVLVKSDLVTAQMDFSVLCHFKENIWGGVSFRGYSTSTLDAAVGLFGFRLGRNFNVTYAYDVSVSDIGPFNSGSHEISLNYQIPLKDRSKAGKIIYNPRFL